MTNDNEIALTDESQSTYSRLRMMMRILGIMGGISLILSENAINDPATKYGIVYAIGGIALIGIGFGDIIYKRCKSLPCGKTN